MRRLDEFRIYYNHTIHPELLRMERKRLRLWLLLSVSTFVMIGILTLGIYLDIPLFAHLLLLSILVFYMSYLAYRIQVFRNNFKPNVINLLLDFIDDGPNFGTLKYETKGFISKQEFLASGIFATKAPEYQGEDQITGKIGELDFKLCELNVREFSRVRNRLDYVFRGVFLTSAFKHKMQGEIVILPVEFKQYLSRSIKAITRRGAFAVPEGIMEENFDEFFMTYATKGLNPTQVLTPDLQTGILDYRLRTGKKMYVSFINENISIAITEPKDLLEPSILKSNVSFELIREFFEDIYMLIHIVEEFDENN